MSIAGKVATRGVILGGGLVIYGLAGKRRKSEQKMPAVARARKRMRAITPQAKGALIGTTIGAFPLGTAAGYYAGHRVAKKNAAARIQRRRIATRRKNKAAKRR